MNNKLNKLLLDCSLKLTKETDIGPGLLELIQSYHEDHVSHSEALKPDLDLIKSYRNPIEGTHLNNSQTTLNSFIRYHAHLASILPKFPPDIGVEFSYTSVFATSSRNTTGLIIPGELPSKLPIKLSNLHYERACVLFNIAALMINLGSDVAPSNTDQLKRSIAHFQQASGCFALLRDTVMKDIELPPDSPNPPSPDLSTSCLSALEHLALSQAQECVWLQAVKDQKSNGTISRIAQETYRLYQLTLDFMKDAAKVDIHWIGFCFPDDWVKFVQLKVAHFIAVAQFRKGLDDSAAREYGIEVGRLEYASSILKAALSASKPSGELETTKNVYQEAKNVHVKLQKSLEQARRDNDLIYLKEVPSETELPVIKPVSLVKPAVPPQINNPINFLTDSQFGRKLFQNVLPYHMYRVKGLYEDRKKDHVKCMIEDVAEQLDLEIRNSLRSMNLPASLEALERPISLPPSLIRNSNELQRRNASQMLINKLSCVEQASQANIQVLNQITMILDQEEEQDGRFRTRFGTQLWQRPPSNLANQSLRQSEAQLLNTLDAATKSDRMVKEKYQHWRHAIELLCQDEDTIRKAIPPLTSARDNLPTQDLNSVPTAGEGELSSSPRHLRRLLDDLEDLREARRTIVAAATYFASRDHIDQSMVEKFNQTPFDKDQVVDQVGVNLWIESILDDGLSKYSKFEKEIHHNHLKEIDLMTQIQRVNEEFIRSRKEDPIAKNREKVIQELDLAYQEFDGIIKNLDEGFRFHSEFYKYINLLKSQVEEYIKNRETEASVIEERLNEELTRSKIDRMELNEAKSSIDVHYTEGDSRRIKSNDKLKNNEVGDDRHHVDTHHQGQNYLNADPHHQSHANSINANRKVKSIVPGTYDPKLHGPPVFLDH